MGLDGGGSTVVSACSVHMQQIEMYFWDDAVFVISDVIVVNVFLILLPSLLRFMHEYSDGQIYPSILVTSLLWWLNPPLTTVTSVILTPYSSIVTPSNIMKLSISMDCSSK